MNHEPPIRQACRTIGRASRPVRPVTPAPGERRIREADEESSMNTVHPPFTNGHPDPIPSRSRLAGSRLSALLILATGLWVSAAPANNEHLAAGTFQPPIVEGGLHLRPFSLDPWQVRTGPQGACLWYHLPPPHQLAVCLGGNASIEQRLHIPESLPGNKAFGGLLTLSVLGTLPGPGEAGYRIDLIDPVSGKTLVSTSGTSTQKSPPVIPNHAWKVTADSVLSQHHSPFNAVDHDPNTLWYTSRDPDAPGHPHHLTIDMGAPRTIEGILYQPRSTGTPGIVQTYAVAVSMDGKEWGKPVAAGRFTYGDNPNQAQTITFAHPVTARFVRFESRSEINGQKWTSAAEIRPLPDAAPASPAAATPLPPARQACVQVPADVLRAVRGKDIVVRLTGTTPRAVILDDVAWRTYPMGKHFNINNWGTYGSKGIYEVDVAPFGIEAISYPNSVFLPVMSVRPDSPAARAGLAAGDIIVGVGGKPLPPAVNRAVKEWTTESHAAVIGRAIVSAQESGAGTVEFRVLRQGDEQPLRLPLPEKVRHPFAPTFPFDCPQTQAMRQDILDYLIRTREPAGCWHNGGNDYMQTSLAGLTLLATHDTTYAPIIKAAADYFLKKYKYPSDLVYLDYWCGSYVGWFLCEYYLASGDQRVIPWLKRMLDWLPRTTHMSWWDYPVWGHDSAGLPYGGKSLISPTIHVYLFGSLARRCGVPGSNWDITHLHLFRSWSDPAQGGHGGIGYGPQLKDVGQAWSRSGMTGLALQMRGERPDMVAAIAAFMREHDYLLFNSHGYGTAGAFLGLLSLSQIDPEAFRRIMPRYRWLFALSWEPGFGMRYSSDHMGYAIRGDGYMTHFTGLFLAIPNHGLCLTGCTERNWLDVSGLPTPLTPVEYRRDNHGSVTLECRLDGPDIRYTLNGAIPGPDSPLYQAPIPLPEGGIVTARAMSQDGKHAGPVTTVAFGACREAWRCESSNNSHIDPQQTWAKLAIDGNAQTWWQTDRWGHAIPPHYLILHVGRPTDVTALTLLPRQDKMRGADIKDYAVYASDDGENWGDPICNGTLPKGKALKTIPFEHVVRTQHLKLEVYSTHGDWSFACAAEIGIRGIQPEISLDESGTKASITCPYPGYSIHYTLDGTLPGPDSPRYETPVDLPAEGVILARCIDADQVAAGPPAVLRAPPVRLYDIRYTVYQGAWSALPDFRKLSPSHQGKANRISLDLSPVRDRFGMVFEGKFRASQAGTYRFALRSDDGSRLFVDGVRLIDNDGEHGAVTREASLSIDQRPHTFRLEYFDAGGADMLTMEIRRE